MKEQTRLAPSGGLVIGATLLLLALFRWPYGYYVFMRWAVSAASAYAAWSAYEYGRHVWTWILGAVAVLFNPIFPFHMTRDVWMLFDVVAAGVLVIAAVTLRRRDPKFRS